MLHRAVFGRVWNAPTAAWPRLERRAARIVARHATVLMNPACGVCGSALLQTVVAGTRPIGRRLYPGAPTLPFGATQLPLFYRECQTCGAARIAPKFRDAIVDGVGATSPEATVDHLMEDPAYVADKQRSIAAHCERTGVARFRSERDSVLDVSCGAGVGLAVLRDRFGWRDCRGIECDPTAAHIARRRRGLDFACGLLHTVSLPEGHFDLVVLDNTLEHHADPKQAMQLVRKALRRGGAALIVVPNFHGRTVELLGIDYWNLNWGHWHYFTAQSLTRLLHEAAFEVDRVQCDGVEQVTADRLGTAAQVDAHVELSGAAAAALAPHDRRLRGDYLTVLAVAV
jgi:SAM-dependent methyltransferase